MKAVFGLGLFLISLPVLAQTAFTVNGELVPASKVKVYMNYLNTLGVRDQVAQESEARRLLVNKLVLEQEARKQKLSESPGVIVQSEARKTDILARGLLERRAKEFEPKEEEIQAAYDELKKNYNPNEIKIRQVIFPSESEAEKFLQKLKEGKDFIQSAKEVVGSNRTSGFDEPKFVNVKLIGVPGLAAAAMTLKSGEILQVPFEGPDGYHVIKLEDKRKAPFPSLSEIKPVIGESLKRRKSESYLANLISSAKVENAKETKPKTSRTTPAKK